MSASRIFNAELAQRVVVGGVLAIVAAIELWLGGFAFWVMVTAAGLLMLSEYAQLLKTSYEDRRLAMYALCIPLGIACPWAAGVNFVGLGALIRMAIAVTAKTRSRSLGAGLLYVGLPVFALLWLRDQPGEQGMLLAFWALAIVWATDIGAFFSGRAIGGPKIAPSISPSKTWAGLVGGAGAALLLGWSLMHYAGLDWRLALASPFLAVLAQVGDFFESWLKRRAGVKDSGRLLHGHGGVLDRLDGLVTSVPVAALLVLAIA